MSFHEQNIEAFTELVKTKRSLFSERDRVSLEKLVVNLPDDEEKISEVIAAWYEQRPKILDAQLDILNSLLTEELNANRSIAAAIARTEAQAEKDCREELIDAIKILVR